MRVTQTDLDDSVVEDGEATTILITDGKTLTAKNREMNGSSPPANGVEIPTTGKMMTGGEKLSSSLQQKSMGMARVPREPVEDCEEEEEEEEEKRGGRESAAVDSLTVSLKGVSIQETASCDLESQLAKLTVNDTTAKQNGNDDDDETRCISLQSQSSIITVDPPSLPHDEDKDEGDEAGGAGSEDLAARGPTAGKPASFRPNNPDNFNRVAGKAYNSHNLDRFHPHHQAATPFIAPAVTATTTTTANGFAPLNFNQNRFYSGYGGAGANEVMWGGGKRGAEDEEDTPFKYTRPVEEEMAYVSTVTTTTTTTECGGASDTGRKESGNNGGGRGGVKAGLLYSQVSVDLNCGGNVVDTSLTPEEELSLSRSLTSGGQKVSYEPQMSMTDLDSMLETFQQMEKADSSPPRDSDPGYYSESSPHSDNGSGSPGSSPKSVFSPPPPASNLSQDSGIASPSSEETLQQQGAVLPGPLDGQSAQNRQNIAAAAYRCSPPGTTLYHSPSHAMSPPSTTHYQSPSSVFSTAMSPPSATHYQSPASVLSTAMSPPSVTHYQSPSSVFSTAMSPPSATHYQSPVSVFSTAMSPPSATHYQSPASVLSTAVSPPSATHYQSPASVLSNAMSPPSVAHYTSPASVLSNAMSPPSAPHYQNPPSVTLYQNVPGMAATMTNIPSPAAASQMYRSPPPPSVSSPYSVGTCSNDGGNDLSAPSPPLELVDSHHDYIFNARKDELRDALDVIADDLTSMTTRRKVAVVTAANNQQATPPLLPLPPPSKQTPPTNLPPSSSLPASVMMTQQKTGGRPEKLPIAPLPKPGRPNAQASPVLNGAVPVMVVPNGMAAGKGAGGRGMVRGCVGMPCGSNGAAAGGVGGVPVTSASLLVVNPVQNTSKMILVVAGNNQPNAAAAAKMQQPKKLQKILPRPGPSVSDCAPTKLNNGLNKAPAGGGIRPPDLPSMPPSAKQEASGNSEAAATVAANNGGMMAGVNGLGTGSRQNGNPNPPNGKKAGCGRNPSQNKMLNIARRLVASMTTNDLQFQDCEGDTYLHVSVCKADKNMVQALLERLTRENLQAMINTQNIMRQTPLYLAVTANSPEMVSLLIQYGADVNVFAEHMCADGRTKEVKAALHCAASHGQSYLPTLQALLAARELNIDLVNSDGHTALHCAILQHNKADCEGGVINSFPIIQSLVKHGVDPNAQGKKSGKTALMLALESRDLTLVEHVVALIDPARLRLFLKTQAFDGSTCQRIMENLQRSLDDASRQRLHACFRI